ncbi:MAG: hypothetical protein ABSB19_01075 [Methylomonas sp.]|jgi:hypothetical protein
MNYQSVHMRDQKANQIAMLNRITRRTVISIVEEVTLVVILWSVFILASQS